jgi:hypothetical protein
MQRWRDALRANNPEPVEITVSASNDPGRPMPPGVRLVIIDMPRRLTWLLLALWFSLGLFALGQG